MRVASLVSGGKDSLFASFVAANGGWEVAAFVTIEPQAEDPLLFHKPNTRWVGLQAEAVGVPWVRAAAEPGDEETAALESALRGLDVDGITTGALASEYQRTRFEAVGHRLGLKTFAPLWHHDPSRHLRQLVGSGFRCRVVHVAAEGLGKDWLGRELDEGAIADLEALAARTGLHPAGEGGEYETFVTDAPHFARPIEIVSAEPDWRRDAGTWRILEARLGEEKDA